MMTNLICGASRFAFFCLQQASVALLPLQQLLCASHTVLQLGALPGLHHQPLLHRWVICPRFLVAMFTGNVRVLEGWEGRGGAGRRRGGGGGCTAQFLQGVGHEDLTPAHVLVRGGRRRRRIAAIVRVKASPWPLQMLPGLLPQLQIRVSVASGQDGQKNENDKIQRYLPRVCRNSHSGNCDSLEDAHLELQSVQDLHKVVHISQQLVGGGDLLRVLVGVVLLQEGEAIHVAVAQPLAVIPVAQTLPLT